ncbi:oligosaccharide flippase family protein [Lacinutrix sp. 5H-3-7-4]|uniref:oligosaccharide flippase family protein n=1 Tax=Lacinutrix sp. (strain 5H-3-7-4) TaxID=983544 RepID=UPI00020A38C6|nr:oligosaccharide flippase family protein [Lacinutrix sp. 5H-3-7-4]AEH01193.1 polysaccharide biosynthesis protein [Lacinutrix sp. 5H-3-7-4]
MQALTLTRKISPEQLFMLSVLAVNGGNYLYNLILGRVLGPAQFADAAVLITFLLVLSFVAMTFQLVTAKFSVIFENETFANFVAKIYKHATIVGLGFGALIIVFAKQLQIVFNTSSSSMFTIFGIGVPLYFLMSVNRGVFQGKKEFKFLSITYQAEMLSRLVITLGLIFLFNIQSSVVIAIGILISFGFGLIPFKFKNIKFKNILAIDAAESKQVRSFFIITAFYELTQIIINNSDILLVKHYFDSYDAGLYASLALIGRIVYFIAWMFVMLLLPTVVQLKKEGKATAPILFKYVGYIAGIATAIIIGCALFPKTAITILFGDSYLAMAPLLWKYALATGLFAISNIFAYYYLSLDRYIPVVISGVFGMLQMGLVIFFHDSLEQVVHMQIIAMSLLLVIQISFFAFDSKLKQ